MEPDQDKPEFRVPWYTFEQPKSSLIRKK